MAARELHVVIDASDVDALCDFWVAALGYERYGSADQFRSALPPAGQVGPKLLFQGVPEAPPAIKNRIHLDIVAGDDVEAEVDRLVQLGATRLGDAIEAYGTGWVVMADPEGNRFCVVHH